jgi:hypothetical protein
LAERRMREEVLALEEAGLQEASAHEASAHAVARLERIYAHELAAYRAVMQSEPTQ